MKNDPLRKSKAFLLAHASVAKFKKLKFLKFNRP